MSSLAPTRLFTRRWTPRVLLRHAAANRTATVAGVVLLVIVVVCLAAPALAPYGPTDFSSDSLAGPSWKRASKLLQGAAHAISG